MGEYNKDVIKIIDKLSCVYCQKICSRKDNLYRHLSTCRTKYDNDKLRATIESQQEILIQQQTIIQQAKIIEQLEEDVESSNSSDDTDSFNDIESEESEDSDESIKSRNSESLEIIKNNNYVYIIKEREFIKTNENVYKVGRTDQGFSKRIKSYPKGSVVMCIVKVPNSKKYETALKKSFNLLFKRRKDIGHEYYEANYQDMYKNMYKVIHNLNKEYNQIVS